MNKDMCSDMMKALLSHNRFERGAAKMPCPSSGALGGAEGWPYG